MESRRKSSVKWTELPSDICSVIQQVVHRDFGAYESEGNFIVEGRIYPEEILLRLGFLAKGDIRQNNFEVSVDIEPGKQKAVDRIQVAMQVCLSLMESFFENRETDFPIEWKPYEIDEEEVYVRYTTFNSDLEAQADELLGDDKKLVYQTTDSEISEMIENLGLDKDEPKVH